MIKTPERFDIRFIDASRISNWLRCEARFLFRSLMGLRWPEEDRIKLDYGTVMHRVLPKMYSGDAAEAIAMFDDLWAKFPYQESDSKRNTMLSHSRIVNFVDNHSEQNRQYDILHFDFSSPAELISENEVPFLIDIDARFPLAGRIDAIIELRSTKRKFAYDFKTSSEISPRYFDSFWFSPQALSYTIAAKQITWEEIDGLAIEVMRISEKNFENQIGFTYVTAVEIGKFIEEIINICIEIETANTMGVYQQNFAMCSAYSGFGFPCTSCEYRLLCSAADWAPLTRFYKREKAFDPLDAKEI